MVFEFFKRKRTLVYNSKKYYLKKEDIPGMELGDKIVIINEEGYQVQSGSFSRSVSMMQRDDESYINGIKVSALIKKLEERKD